MKYIGMGLMLVLNSTLFVLCLTLQSTLGAIGALLNAVAAIAWAGNILYSIRNS